MTTIGTTAWTVLAAAACLGTGLLCVALAAARIGDRPAQLTHGAMGVTMAAMLSPWGDPVPVYAGVAGFAVLAAWFGAAALRGARAPATHLAISSAAMALMYVGGHHRGAPEPAAGGPHAGHVGGGVPDLVVMPLALLLAGYFAWHAWTCVDRARTATPVLSAAGPTGVPAGTRSPARVEPLAHGVMSALMAAMLLGAA